MSQSPETPQNQQNSQPRPHELIAIRNLKKRFEVADSGPAAIDDVSVNIDANCFFTLLGPSGCGKSTLLRCIAGLEQPDEGEIMIGDMVAFSSTAGVMLSPNRRRIGMVFQSYAIWPHMTVGQNVAFPLEVQRKPNIREETLKALELVGLSGFEDRYASKLSGGQQQRVALARAIVAKPDVLLLDEPLSNLDAALRDQMRAELLKIQRSLKVTTIYVTHDQTEALSMSDRIAVMSKGRFVEIAAPEELYNRPRTAFAARFIGGANIIHGVAEGSKGGLTRIRTDFGDLLTAERAENQVELFIRPEKLVPQAEETKRRDDTNLLECTIQAWRFTGDNSEFDLVPKSTGSGGILHCKANSSWISSIEAPLLVQIDPVDVHVLASHD